MNTNTIQVTAAAVSGARHLRVGRNGQDAAVAWSGGGQAALVVCDGCGSGAHSEVGARLGATLVISALGRRLRAGAAPLTLAAWDEVRAEVVAVLGRLVDDLVGGEPTADRADVVHAHFLFTIVAAVLTAEEVAVWALGDGAYRLDDHVVELPPGADNAPPYLGYDLLGDPRPAHLHRGVARVVMVATDGLVDLPPAHGLAALDAAALVAHPDALRRRLALAARADERLDWDARRVVRVPALLQDDGAVAIARRAS